MCRPSTLKLGASTRWSRGVPRRRSTTVPLCGSTNARYPLSPPTARSRPSGMNPKPLTRPSRDPAEVSSGRSVRASASVTVPSRCPTASSRPSGLTAWLPSQSDLGSCDYGPGRRRNARPSRRSPREVPDEDLAVEAAGVERPAVGADREPGRSGRALCSVSPTARASTSQTIKRLSSPAVTAARPSGPNAARTTRAVVTPEGRPVDARGEIEEAHRAVAGHRPPSCGRPGSSAAASPPTGEAPYRAQRARIADHGGPALEGRDHVLPTGNDHHGRDRAEARRGPRHAEGRPVRASKRWTAVEPTCGLSTVAMIARPSDEKRRLVTNRDCEHGKRGDDSAASRRRGRRAAIRRPRAGSRRR